MELRARDAITLAGTFWVGLAMGASGGWPETTIRYAIAVVEGAILTFAAFSVIAGGRGGSCKPHRLNGGGRS